MQARINSRLASAALLSLGVIVCCVAGCATTARQVKASSSGKGQDKKPGPLVSGSPEAESTADASASSARPGRSKPSQSTPKPAGKMDLSRLEAILRQEDLAIERNKNVFRLTVNNVQVLVMTDPSQNRMRMIVPIRPVDSVEPEQWRIVMDANFHSALDARYATSSGILYSAFIHPLSPLTKRQILSGLRQTVNLARTFGTNYSSGELVFGGAKESKPSGKTDLM